MSHYPPPYGVGLRRDGGCKSSEVECGRTLADFYSCCRQNTYCNMFGGQIYCCPKDEDCSADIAEDPHCANDIWDLYHKKDTYLCCEQGLIGYYDNKLNAFGCADGIPNATDVTLATPINNVDQSSSSTTIVTATVTPKSNPDNNSPSPSSSASTGVIAGSTVGGVAGFILILACIWFLVRRRKQQESPAELGATPMKQPLPIAELHNDVVRAELDSGAAAAHELPAR